MKLKLFGSILAGLMLIAGSPQAAVLSLDFTGSIAGNLDASFDSAASGGLVSNGQAITIYDGPLANPTGGLQLDSPADLTVTYLGKEAGFTNIFHLGADLFDTSLTAPNTSQSVLGVAAGIIPFLFQSSGGGGVSAENGGPIPAGVSIAFADLGGGVFLALFNDPGSDVDWDDMVVKINVSQVPLPAAVWLLISAILGLVSFTRMRRSEARTA